MVSPYEYSGDQIAQYGYEAADIAGEYEYINHGNDTSSKIHNYSSVTLSTDGTISGAVSGTWSQAQDSAAAVLTIDGTHIGGRCAEVHQICTLCAVCIHIVWVINNIRSPDRIAALAVLQVFSRPCKGFRKIGGTGRKRQECYVLYSSGQQ